MTPSLAAVALLFALLSPAAAFSANNTASVNPDNTSTNKVDKTNPGNTAQAQPNDKSDLALASAIRKAILNDKSLSSYAHNVKIIVKQGTVTLRGPVKSIAEQDRIADLARRASNVDEINNLLTVKSSK